MPQTKLTAIIAATLMSILILTGAAVVVYHHEMTYYDFEGNILGMNDSFFSNMYEPGSQEYKFEQKLRKNQEDNTIILALYKSSTFTFSAYKTIEDYDELKDYLQNNGGEQFNFPEYIPDGFDFKYAYVYFILEPDIDYENFEPIYYEEKFGNIYEKYLLPEDSVRVDRVVLHYGSGKQYISFHIGFSGELDGMKFGLSVPVETVEALDIPQFDRSVVISQKHGRSNLTSWNLKAVKLIDEPVDIFHIQFISKIWRENQNPIYLKNFKTWEARSIMYTIDSSNTSRDEIIKIAESIK